MGHAELLIPDHDDLLQQPGNRGLHVLYSIHNQRSGRSALNRGFGQAMDVWVIPIESRRLISWELHVVLERVSGIDQGFDYVITMALRSGIGSPLDLGLRRWYRRRWAR